MTIDALTKASIEWPWVPGQRLTHVESLMLRRYVASHPWRPGDTGKGIVTPMGRVLTWRVYDTAGELDVDGGPWHELVIRALYPELIGDYGDVRASVVIDIDGSWDARGGNDSTAADRGRIAAYIDRASPPVP